MEPNSHMVLISREGKVIKFLLRGKSTIIHNLHFESANSHFSRKKETWGISSNIDL